MPDKQGTIRMDFIKRTLKWLAFFSVLLFFGIAWYSSTLPEPQSNTTTNIPVKVLPTYPRVPEVDQMFRDLGITDIAQIEVKLTDDTGCKPSPTLRGCAFSYDDHMTMYLTSVWQQQPNRYSTIAHEYLHWIWSKGDRASTTELMAVYNSNSYFQQRMSFYNYLGVGSEAFLNELNSTVCTEWADSALPFSLLSYCTKHIPNRNILPSNFR